MSRTLLRGITGVAGLIALPNLVILAATHAARRHDDTGQISTLPDMGNGRAVDDRVWRGSAPNAEQYAALAGAGVRTIVDLRAEGTTGPSASLGLTVHRLSIHDGWAPDHHQVTTMLDIIAASRGIVFVHCAAGVGRTGSMVGAYRVLERNVAPPTALREMLAVGPPSLEQIAFVSALGTGAHRPGTGIVLISTTVDGPRRVFGRLRKLAHNLRT